MRKRPQGGASLLISIAVHIVLGVVLLWALSIPSHVRLWLEQKAPPPAVQHLTFIQVVPPAPSTVGRSGGNNRPITPHQRPAPPAPPLVAPRQIPTTIPPAAPAPKNQGGSGPVVGQGGLQRGVTPSFSDPRIWLPPGDVESSPPTVAERAERLDSTLVSRLHAHEDSLAALAATGRAPGDWTFEHNGKKFGIDQHKIYLGKFSIPSAILALIKLNRQGNPIAAADENALNYQRTDIMYQAQRAMNEEEFEKAVKEIRERNQRAHDEAKKQREEEKKKAQQTNVIAQPQ